MARIVKGSAVSFGILVLWLVVGVLPSLLYGKWPTSPGTFGDSFGAANSLFSAAALIGVVVSLYLQRRHLEETIADQKDEMQIQTDQIRLQTQQTQRLTEQTKLLTERTAAQIQQTEDAQKTTRLQAFLSLNEFYHRMLLATDNEVLKRPYRSAYQYNAGRVKVLMEELGETFPDAPPEVTDELPMPTKIDEGLAELSAIVEEFVKDLRQLDDDPGSNEQLNDAINRAVPNLRKWITSFNSVFRHHEIMEVNDCVGGLFSKVTGGARRTKHEPQIKNEVARGREIASKLHNIVESLSQAQR